MAIGIAGDTILVYDGVAAEDLMVIELRVLSNLIQSTLGTNMSIDDLKLLRNDQAFELGNNPAQIPGN